MTSVHGLRIIISREWRLPPLERLLNVWRKAGLAESWIAGFTPDLSSATGSVPEKRRGLEIQRWLHEHANKTARYAILDDQIDEIEPCFPVEVFFKTDPVRDLDQTTTAKVNRHLSSQDGTPL